MKAQTFNAKKRTIAAVAKSSPPEPAPLIEFLQDKDRNVRCATVKVLGQMKEQSAVGAIIHLLEKEKWHYVRSAAWKALKRISPEAYKETRIKSETTFIQLFAVNFRNLPWWIGLILLITPFPVHFFMGPSLYYTYYLPLYYKYVLPSAGFFLLMGFLTKIFFRKKKVQEKKDKKDLE